MRPTLKPALRRVWRDNDTVQLGVDTDRAAVLTGLDDALRAVLENLTGEHTDEAVVAEARRRGVTPERARRLLRLLADAGVLDDADLTDTDGDDLGPVERDRLEPDLAAWSLVSRGDDGGQQILRTRRHARVVVHGAGRVGASAATLLDAAGVGEVQVVDQRTVRPEDLAPAGLVGHQLGMPRGRAMRQRLREQAVRTRETRRTRVMPTRPDIVVLAPDDEADRRLCERLARAGLPHLVARIREARGIIGPLVVPGTTSCVRCHDLHRLDRDPGWARILTHVQEIDLPVRAVDVVIASTVAALAALHVLGFLDGGHPPSVDGTVELTLPYGTCRRRSWLPHPGCGCQWDHLDSQARATMET